VISFDREDLDVKGTIVICLQEVVESKAGRPGWMKVLEDAGLPKNSAFQTNAVVPDEDVLKLISSTATVLGITKQAAMDAFGEHWGKTYAPSMYGIYYDKYTNAHDFLLHMDEVHVAMTKFAGASPPHFTFKEVAPTEIVMNYSSPRGLVALMPSLIKGVGAYYKQKVTVRPAGNDMHITFG